MSKENETLEDIFGPELGDDDLDQSQSGAGQSEDGLFSGIDAEDSLVASATEGFIKIGKTNFAIGLTWNTAVEVKNASKEARLAAKSDAIGADFYCIRGGESAQYGLGRSSLGHKAGMPSLAEALNAVLSDDADNWLAAFRVDGQYYVAAARDGLILSDLDRVFLDEADAREAFSNMHMSADWEVTASPAEWEFSDSNDLSLSEITLNPKASRLKSANPAKSVVKLVVIAAIIGGAAFGVKTAIDHYEERQQEILQQIRAAQRENERVNTVVTMIEDKVAPVLGIELEREEEIEVAPNPPWLGRKNGVGQLITCSSDVLKGLVSVPGWDTTDISCRDGTVSMSMTSTGGTLLWADSFLRKQGYDGIDMDNSIGSASISVSFDGAYVSEYPHEIATQDLNEVRRYLLTHFDELRLPIMWSRRNTNPESIVDRYYTQADFNFTLKTSPEVLAPIFSKIKAFEITNINYSLDSSEWTIQGTVWHKRPTPLPRPVTD